MNTSAIKQSFLRVKTDIYALKKGMQDWCFFLNNNQQDLKARVAALEQQVQELKILEIRR